MKLITAAQAKTLRTLIARGGEMNIWAGQPGFYCNSVRPLVRLGFAEWVAECEGCANAEKCVRPLAGQPGGDSCYGRVQINDAGRASLAAYDASKES